MTLKNPSDLFNFKKAVRTEEFVVEAASDSIVNLSETFDKLKSFERLKDNINKIEELSNTLSTLKENISDKVSKSELDAAIFSQLMVMDEIFKKIQSQIKGLNKEDLDEYSSHINGLTEYVKEFTEVEIPKYKKQVLSTELRFSEKLESYQKIIEDELNSSDDRLNSQLTNVAEVIDNQLNSFNNQLQETKTEVLKTSDTYNKLYKIVETKGVKENERLDEYNIILENFNEQLDKFNVEFTEFQQLAQKSIDSHITKLQENVDSISSSLDEKFNEYDSHLNEFVIEIESDFDTLKSGLSKKFTDIETDVIKVEKHLKDTNSNLHKVEEYIKENHNELISLREEVFSDVSKLPVGNIWENIERLDHKINQIKEAYSKIEPEVIIKQVITEGGFAEPSSAKNSDPLTPVDQNFVTLAQLQQHYRLFLNRIQQQISTIGGGGETRLKYLDDIVGIATNPSAYDGNFLRYNHDLRKFEFVEVTSGPNNGTVNYANTAGIATNVIGGIGSITSLSVSGISTLGTVRISSGIITATSGVVTYYGDGSKLTGITATVGLVTYSTSAGYANTAGIATNVIGGIGSVTSLSVSGISTLGTVRISSGIITATSGVVTYYGDGSKLTGVVATYATSSGISTYAPNAGIATYATSSGISTYATSSGISSTLTSTASVNTTGIITAISFSGSGLNLSSLNASNLSSGTVPSQRITASSGNFTVGQNLFVNGTLSVGGTSVILNAATLQVSDKDIVLGITTNVSGDDVSTDNTANHGGIAIASTEGSPIINIPIQIGVNSKPSTYKQFMWVRRGNYSGMGTDAWVSNYAISIGNTSTVANGSRLTVGTGFTVYDGRLDVSNVFSTGIVTAFSFVGNLTGIANTAINVIGGIGSVTSLSVSDISTLGTIRIFSGIVTATSGVVTYFGDGRNLTGVATTSHQATHRLGGTDVITPAMQTMSDANVTVSATVTIVGTSATFTAPRTVTLPSASTVPSGLSINIIDTFGAINGANTLTILRAGTDTINGITSISMGAPRSVRQLFSNGSNAWSFDVGVLRSSANLSDVIAPSIARTNIGAISTSESIINSLIFG